MAKFNKEYKQNRKLKTGKKVLDGLTGTQYGPDGNPIISSTTQQSNPFGSNPNYLGADANSGNYSTPETGMSNSNNIGQYAGIATAAGVAGANYAKTYNDPNASLSDKTAAGRQGVGQIAGSINPVVGGIINGVNAIAKPIKNNAEKMDSQGNLQNQSGAQAGAIVGNFLSPSTLATTISSGKWDLTGKKYANSLEADAKQEIWDAGAADREAAKMERNKYYTFENGGNLTRYENGGKHSESPHGGIPIGPDSLVEEGETRGMENTPTKDYIYSDTLKVPGKKYTYAKASKMIENKYSKRDNDKMSKEAMEKEITSLMHSQEELREGMINKAYKKAYKCGGKIKRAYGGPINPITGLPEQFVGPRATQENYNNGFGVDNTDLINATTDLGQAAAFGSNAVNRNDGTNQLDLTANTVRDYTVAPTGFVPKYNPYSKSLKPFALDDNKFADLNMNPGQVVPENSPNSVSGSPTTSRTPMINNFENPNLYNAGNFMGGLYDIGRGVKGGDAVNYDRVNPEMVDYSASREMNRRDSKEGFKNVQRELRNVNNPGQYLSLITQNAAQRDKALFDSNTKSYESEKNQNVAARNQSKYFNAQVQKQEADARQMEKDIASNTVQKGMADFGEALAGTGRDKAAVISQAEAKKFIGSVDYSPITDKKGKIVGYKHKSSNKTYKIQ